jgi:hypothetical protein
MDEQRNSLLEDTLLGSESPTIDVFDAAQYKESKEYWDDAQLLKELSFHAGYKKLLQTALDKASLCARLLRQYRGVDSAEKEIRLQNQRIADGIVEFLKANVDDAVNTPRPILHKQQQ